MTNTRSSACFASLVFKAMDRCRDSSASCHKCFAGEIIHWHDRCIAKETAEFNSLSHTFSNNRDQADCSGLLVYHSDCCFICNDSGNGGSLGISRYCDHIKSYSAYTGHSFQFLNGKRTCSYRIDHSLVLTDRDKCAA